MNKKINNVAVVIGHHKKAKGAFSDFFELAEFDFYTEVVKYLNNVDVFEHDAAIKSYTKRIKNTAKKLDNYKLVIELHFNAAIPAANGCETLYYFNSKKGKEYAFTFSKIVNDVTGIKLRNNGLKALVNANDRGYASVFYPAPPAIFIEPFFGSNEGDCMKIAGPKTLANIINTFLLYI